MNKTGISWTDRTWNPVRGCSRVSEGCRNCYAEKIAARFSYPEERTVCLEPGTLVKKAGAFEGFATSRGWTGKVALIPEKLDEPLRLRKPSRIFVNSTSDLFHEKLSNEDISAVLRIPWTTWMQTRDGTRKRDHTYQILTKRPERMADYFEWLKTAKPGSGSYYLSVDWPLPNVWLGISAEDQETFNERAAILSGIPAALTFWSLEPLLEEIDFGNGLDESPDHSIYGRPGWVIVGGESGANARPFNVGWARSVVAQCKAAGVPCFVKQLGARPSEFHDPSDVCCWRCDQHPGKHPFTRRDPDGINRPFRDRSGADPSEWPVEMRVQEFPR